MKRIVSILSILTFLLAACGGSPTANGDEVGPAPDFSLPNALDGKVALSDYAGQPVLLYFHMAVG